MNKTSNVSGRRRKNGLNYKFNPFTQDYKVHIKLKQNDINNKDDEYYNELKNIISKTYKESIYFTEYGNRFKIPKNKVGVVMKYLEENVKCATYQPHEKLIGIRLFLNIDK